MKVTRKVIEINEDLCDGCGLCVPSCAEGAIKIINGKARLVAEKYCDGLGACLGECPQGALKVTEREAEDFDYKAVEEYLNFQNQAQGQPQSQSQSQLLSQGQAQSQLPRSQPQSQPQSHVQNQIEEGPEGSTLACGCPSTRMESFKQTKSCQEANSPVEHATMGTDTESGLSHWPVQIKLVPPSAPFLKGADLLVLADCTAVTYPDLHRDFLPGKAVLMGCPKFDNVEEHIQKLSSIFKTADIRRITVLMMEVPCCSGLSAIVEKGLTDAGKQVPIEKIIITTRGKLLCGKS
jgi:NAD-dependent dihydropyrimidine dehydrogenase PreA subunit